MKTRKTSRRQLLLGAGATVMAHWPRSLSAGTAGLQPIAPGDAGFAPDLEARLEKITASADTARQAARKTASEAADAAHAAVVDAQRLLRDLDGQVAPLASRPGTESRP